MKIIATDKAPTAIGPYSQAYEVNGFLFTSGQIPLDPATGTVVGTEIAAQAEQSCRNIGAILEAASLDFAAFNAVYEKFFVSKPARSCVAVKQLPKGVLCEIEAIAAAD